MYHHHYYCHITDNFELRIHTKLLFLLVVDNFESQSCMQKIYFFNYHTCLLRLRATFCKNQAKKQNFGTHPLRIGSNSFFCWFGMFWQWNGHLFWLDWLILRNFNFWKKNWFSIFSKFEKSIFFISSFWKPQQNQMTFSVCMDRLDFKTPKNPKKKFFSCWRLNLGLGKEGSKFG